MHNIFHVASIQGGGGGGHHNAQILTSIFCCYFHVHAPLKLTSKVALVILKFEECDFKP